MKLSPSTWSAILIVTALAMLGSAIRLTITMQELLWLDELHTSWTLNGSIGEIAGRAADGNQSPLFFWLAWFPVRLFGESEFSVRFVSLIAGTGVMLFAAWLVRKWTCSTVAATVVAVLMSIDMQFIYYATEARPYALLQLMSVVQVALFWRRLNKTIATSQTDENRNWMPLVPDWGLAAASVCLVYIHITAIWLFVAELIFLAIFLTVGGRFRAGVSQRRNWELGNRLITASFVSALACLPVVIQMLSVFRRRENWELVSSPVNVLRDLSQTFILTIIIPLTCLVVFQVVAIMFRKSEERSDSNSPPESPGRPELALLALAPAFVILWAIVPAACVGLLSVLEIAPMALSRYTLVGSAAFPIFAGLAVTLVKTTPKRLAMGMLIVGTALWQNPLINFQLRHWELPLLRTEDWKSPVDAINADRSKAHHPVFLFSNLIEDVDAIELKDPEFQRYLLFPVHGLYELKTTERRLLPRPTIQRDHFAEGDVEIIKQQRGAWILVRGHPELLDEIGMELGTRMREVLGEDSEQIRSNLLETPGSPVYLWSIDW